jgi:hypothetical protein
MPVLITAQTFDDAFAPMTRSDLLWQLGAEAYGEDYPPEVQPRG